MSVNKTILIGNVSQNPDVKNFDNGGQIVSFSLATNERAYKTKAGIEVPEKVDFHNIVVKGGLTKIAESYIHKGDKVYIEGKLSNRKYDKDGLTHYVTEVVVDGNGVIELLGGKKSESAVKDEISAPELTTGKDEDELPF
jgi:single-strand DNA-binding protein